MSKIVLPKKFVSQYPHKFAKGKQMYLRGKRILPKPISGKESLPDLIDATFLAYNAGRLSEGCRLFAEKMLANDRVTVGMSLAGALTPAGLGSAAVIPLIKAGFVDWIVATGANLYHDMHHAMNLPLWRGSPFVRDPELRRYGVVRIYDILLDYNDVLMRTDDILRKILIQKEFQKEMGTAELHCLIGKYCAEFERQSGLKDASVLAAAYRAGVPCFCSSPGDSTIGMNIAGVELRGNKLRVNPASTSTKPPPSCSTPSCASSKTGVVLVGGGSPKNFTLQTEPQIQEVLRIKEMGHDYFLQFTDARPDTGGLSGATPSRGGELGQDRSQPAARCGGLLHRLDHRACRMLTHYALARRRPRKLKRLYDRRPAHHEAADRRVFRPQQRRDADQVAATSLREAALGFLRP